MKKALFLLMIFVSSFAGFYGNSAEAASQREPKRDRGAQCQLISKSSAMRMAASQTGSKVVSASLTRGSRPMYRVKVINSAGRIRYVSINACR